MRIRRSNNEVILFYAYKSKPILKETKQSARKYDCVHFNISTTTTTKISRQFCKRVYVSFRAIFFLFYFSILSHTHTHLRGKSSATHIITLHTSVRLHSVVYVFSLFVSSSTCVNKKAASEWERETTYCVVVL